ncbi:MAG: TIGR01777 family oxidoreductase [Polyangiaceae bacterium]
MTKVLVTGGTGFVGAALVESLLDDGNEVSVLGRDAGRIRVRFGSRARAIVWSTATDAEFAQSLAGHEVVFNLAGEQAVGRRYTAGSKQRIRDSRVKATRVLVDALGATVAPPWVLISASAVGYYGAATGEICFDETRAQGTGFLAELCHEWEAAALRAEALGTRVVLARLGVVLGPGGGAFESMARPFLMGMGGRLGDGRQPFSFISLEDCVRALRFCSAHLEVRGPVNVTAPVPTDGAGVARALGSALDKPNWLPVPSLALRALFGEGAESLLTGQSVVPSVLLDCGFEFNHPTIDLAVAAASVRARV